MIRRVSVELLDKGAVYEERVLDDLGQTVSVHRAAHDKPATAVNALVKATLGVDLLRPAGVPAAGGAPPEDADPEG